MRFISIYIFLLPFLVLKSDLLDAEGFETHEGVRIVFTGDVFLGNWAAEFIEKYGVDYPFRDCKDILKEADLCVCNLEGPITSDGEPFPEKEFVLKMPPGIQQGLKEANFLCVNLANNHIMDYGEDGLNATFQALDSSNIKYFGAGENRSKALIEASFELKGQTFGFLGFSATFPMEFWATDSTAGTAFPWNEDIEKVIPECDKNYDNLIVSFHWSAELKEIPKDYQIELAHKCIDLGADMIIGHHPHVPQSIEIYRKKPIFYSLGNFAFASYSENAEVGLLVSADFNDDGLSGVKVIPVNVYNNEVNFNPAPLKGGLRDKFLERLRDISQELNSESIVITDAGKLKF